MATTTDPFPIAPCPVSSEPGVVIADTEMFLDDCERAFVPPERVESQLVRAGWEPYTAMQVTERYRARFDEHPLGYAGFLFSVGFSALSAGSTGHLLLAFAEGRDPSPEALAFWLTILVIAVPFAIWSWLWVRRVDDSDPVAAWSGPRRTLATALLWCCGIVGGFRLLHYVFTFIATITGSGWATDRNLAVGFAHVLVTTSITLPLGIWSFRFLHRFDR